MKNKIYTTVAFLLLGVYPAFSQHIDANINVLNFIFSKYELGVEYGFNDKVALGINVNTTSKNMTEGGGKEYSEFNIIPTFKYFLTPEKGADGFYLGAFARYRSSASNKNDFYTLDNNSVIIIEQTNVTSSAIGMGALTGYKWVASNGFIVEAEFGVGKLLSNSIAISNSKAEDETKNLTKDWDEIDYLPILGNKIPVDLRLGLKIGYRIK